MKGLNTWTQFSWNKSFIKQVQHIFKANNVKIFKVQKAFFKKPSQLHEALSDFFLP